ncbi:MAG: VWA domain-containing protein [Candidatus Omnitrophota bacterium]
MIFYDPWVLLLILFIGVGFYFLRRREDSASLRFSSEELIIGARPTLKLILARNLILVRFFVICLVLLALARPQLPIEEAKVESEGVDIVLALDSSGSMLAEDFKIGNLRRNRLAVVKEVVEEFIRQRKSDRIGMIAFAARAYTVCPLTLDYDWLIKNLERVEIGNIEDGTAIGSAISSSVNRLKNSLAKSKIIILLTDGINNVGRISPLTAAEAAQALGIKIYTIGVGTKGAVPYPAVDLLGRKLYQNIEIEIDEDALQQIAQTTQGKYYRATDTESLRDIYQQIDSLERTSVEAEGFSDFEELFFRFLAAAVALLIIEIVLSHTVLRKLP